MTHAMAMVDAYPAEVGMDRALLARSIEVCFDCAQTCTACADACLSEDGVAEFRKCIRTCLDCADLCTATGRVLSRHTGYDASVTRTTVGACLAACRSCGDECERLLQRCDHCRICAETCRACEEVCRQVQAAIG